MAAASGTVDGGLRWAARMDRHRAVSIRLGSLGDRSLEALLEDAVVGGVGIGGSTAVVTVDGVPVFVKKVSLTDLERRREHIGSTVNVFGLPACYQYGIGSAGFGAWRELAAQVTATGWVVDGRFHGFPMLYHWRVLPQAPRPIEAGELERWVAYWDGCPAVRARLTAVGESSVAVVLFMEYLPYTVDRWLRDQVDAGSRQAIHAIAMVDRDLRAGTGFMRSRGLWHFDAHFHNLLTDGHRVYFADFGLATSWQFHLSAAERVFLRQHTNYDRCYTATHLARWLVSTLLQTPWAESGQYIRDHVPGRRYTDLPAYAERIVSRDAAVATVMDQFFSDVQTVSKSIPYPGEALDTLCR